MLNCCSKRGILYSVSACLSVCLHVYRLLQLHAQGSYNEGKPFSHVLLDLIRGFTLALFSSYAYIHSFVFGKFLTATQLNVMKLSQCFVRAMNVAMFFIGGKSSMTYLSDFFLFTCLYTGKNIG